MKKRLLTIAIAAAILASACPVFAAGSSGYVSTEISGTVLSEQNDTLQWSLTDGELKLSGSGALREWTALKTDDKYPWSADADKITKVTLENGIISIGNDAFSGCVNLESVTIPESVTAISKKAFFGCGNLKSIELPGSVESIGESAFEGCVSLEKTVIPDKVSEISSSAFSGCTGLNEITLPAGVKRIGYWAFLDCTSLAAITLPDGLETIAGGAFSGCSALTNVNIPGSVSSIENEAFLNCTGLTNIEVSADNAAYTSEDGVLLCKDKTELVQYPAAKTGAAYAIPDSVKQINNNAFRSAALKNITIPQTVTSIGAYAFADNKSLTAAALPEGLTFLGSGALFGCVNVKEVNIPQSLSSIEDDVFSSTGITQAVIPDNAASIGKRAFKDCKSLESVTIGNNVTEIGEGAFAYDDKLTAIKIPDTVTAMGGGVFMGCAALKTAKLSDNLTEISRDAFNSCSALEDITIPDKVTHIWDSSFTLCEGLTKVKLPASLKRIEKNAFAFCWNVTEIEIPAGMESIAEKAFDECSELETVHYNGTAEDWSRITIEDGNACLTEADIQYGKTSAYPYEIKSIAIRNITGEELTSIPEGSSFIAEVTLDKTAQREGADYVFVTAYDASGALVSLDYVRAAFAVGSDYAFGFNIPKTEKAVGSIKAYVWHSFTDTEPLANTVIWRSPSIE